ncbi:POK19 protein, partial [Edolisoma coerulescens]|nr:POK19 protein [Edolisoma coerulescens]
IQHATGIPHSPTGQALIERAHSTLKRLLGQQKERMQGAMPQDRSHKALYVFNFLNCYSDSKTPPIVQHFGQSAAGTEIKAPVLVKDLQSGKVLGPFP